MPPACREIWPFGHREPAWFIVSATLACEISLAGSNLKESAPTARRGDEWQLGDGKARQTGHALQRNARARSALSSRSRVCPYFSMQIPNESGILPAIQPQKVRSVVYEQDGFFVAQCLDVDVVSEGDTEEEAVVNLREALELYFDAEAPVMMPSRAVRFGEIVIHA